MFELGIVNEDGVIDDEECSFFRELSAKGIIKQTQFSSKKV